MSALQKQEIVDLLAQERWPEAATLVQKAPPASAADFLGGLTDLQQQALFGLLPVKTASQVLSHFPYYHQYVLLHTRNHEDMGAILDAMSPDERARFFDELPEEAWQRLSEEIGEPKLSTRPPGTTREPDQLQPKPVRPPMPAPAPPAIQTQAISGQEAEAGEPVIELRGVEKSFVQQDGDCVEVVAPLDLSVYPGTILALLGASGCGKSTLLRMLSGLAEPTSGQVLWHGKPFAEAKPNVAMVFQSFALFPWLTVLENVEAPLLARGVNAHDRHKRALQAINTVGLKGFQTAYPKELSGGMRQRVGFARALVVEPEVLFMDEPFSALDVLTAENLRGELLELWLSGKLGAKTIFIVTHNIEEAVLLADRVIVLGRNPARVRADFRVPLHQPRDRKSPQFLLYVDFIYKVMTKPEAVLSPPKLKGDTYQPLPHTGPAGIAGLLEVLLDTGGEEDLYHLAERLLMDVEDLLPIIEGAVMLGFARLEEGDAKITPAGKAFAEADIGTRKKLFREAVLDRLLLFRQIMNILTAKSDHSIPVGLFRDILDEHFPDNQVETQLATALHWGRYCEMFSYDSEQERLFAVDTAPATERHVSQ
ncbi:MAG TPA: AAA-associated domain-containing protein [Candidatus Angelobacter sp.]|jgi:NitT/TauT family transport system ATP-binding protein|nr:AAA-associated domain-containing protein [Candidatus Angelobacter sp.]